MTRKAIDQSAKSDRAAISRRAPGNNAKSTRDLAPTSTNARKRETPPEHPGAGHVTKHAQLLQLLSRPDGASIEEMMLATEWQQHSVRGYLAGTVKKKMGLALTSFKAEGDVRRYRIASGRRHAFSATRRGR